MKVKTGDDTDAEVKVLEDELAKFMCFDVGSESGLTSRGGHPTVSMDDMLKWHEEYFEKELKGKFYLSFFI
jgi:hypothetical protein